MIGRIDREKARLPRDSFAFSGTCPAGLVADRGARAVAAERCRDLESVMIKTTLTNTESACLMEAAGRDGLVVPRETLSELGRARLLGKLLKENLIAFSASSEEAHHLTPAGYRAVGLRPPRIRRAAQIVGLGSVTPKAPSKQERVLALLGRDGGASLAELIEATGWLPHTTRAALSRLRSSGRTLAKNKREDGGTVYRLVIEESLSTPKRAARRRPVQVEEATAA